MTGTACCVISRGDSNFFALFLSSHNTNHTVSSESHSQPTSREAVSALKYPKSMIGTPLSEFQSAAIYLDFLRPSAFCFNSCAHLVSVSI